MPGPNCGPSCRLSCRLSVFWWAQSAKGRWVEVSHAPVDVQFTGAADLRA